MSSKNKAKKNPLLDTLIEFLYVLKDAHWYAIKNIRATSKVFWINLFLLSLIVFLWSVKNTHFYILGEAWKKAFPSSIDGFVNLTAYLPWWTHFILLFPLIVLGASLYLGLPLVKLEKRVNRSLKQSGLKNNIGEASSVKKVERYSKTRFYAEINGKGVSLEDFKKKTNSLRAAANSEIESISEKVNHPGTIEVLFNKEPLSKMIKYSDVCTHAQKEGEFIIGKSKKGLIKQNIGDFPHMLFAGSSGYGKSYFLKQMVLNLIENTPNLQVYIFDFKEGISFKLFKSLPNVKLYSDIFESNEILDLLKKEMEDRFKLLKEGDEESIDFKKHKKDPILIVIDECSLLYSISKYDKEQRKISIKAIETTEQIGKLSRAAKFNMVIGSQKITKNTIDTRIQTNLEGRICFKVPDVSASTTVVGNKSASCLPNIKGRAMYKFNTVFDEVQTPFLDNEELKKRVEIIKKEFKSGKRVLNQPMLDGEKSTHKNQEEQRFPNKNNKKENN